jgi:hypothetical protein
VLWGWGQAATGDRRGFVLAAVEIAWLGTFAWFVPPLLDGGFVTAIFVAGVAFVAAWAAVALHAYRLAIRRGRPFDRSRPDGGAADLLWLAPAAMVGMTFLWAVGGTLARPESAMARYVHDWQVGDPADAVRLFASSPTAATLASNWEAQLATLRNELVRMGAVGGEDEGLDPARPFERIRFVDVPSTMSGESGAPGSVRRIDVQLVKIGRAHV